jgi:hypothetical protein
MAIRRCPYCKAIIDEQDKYCNNCGTQLLFPEDELIEEEIPGDKIIDKDETKEEELEEREETEEAESEEEKDTEEKEDLEKLEEEEDEEEEEDDDDSEELEEPAQEEEEELEEPVEEIKAGEPIGTAALVDELHKKYQVTIEEDELVFKTKDLDNLTKTVDEGKEKLEGFLSSYQKEKVKDMTPHEVPALFQEGEEPGSTTKEVVPPWASGMKESPPSTADLEELAERRSKEEVETGQAPTGSEWRADSGIGIPEKVTQAGLPFGTAAMPATPGEKEEVTEKEEREGQEAEPGQRVGFSLKLKSKLVDLVFITALWLITLWFTAQVIGVSFLRVIVGSPVPVLALYFILLLLYFFLFLYFLGETLGDHYFSDEE